MTKNENNFLTIFPGWQLLHNLTKIWLMGKSCWWGFGLICLLSDTKNVDRMTQEGGFHNNWYESDNYAVHDNTVSYAISKVWKIL